MGFDQKLGGIMKKRILPVVLSLLTFFAVACGGNKEVKPAENTASAEKELKVVTVAASPTPHAEILYQIVDDMKVLGYDLRVKEFSDYVQPNTAVEEGSMMANYFQHTPYLDDFNKERGTHIVTIRDGKIHYEPFGIYAGKKKDINAIEKGDKIAVPNDVTNEARALLLLESAGIIKLKEGVGLTATKLDIVENPSEIEIVELESAQIPRAIGDVSYACMNGNYALEANYKVSDALFVEKADSAAAQTYANIICVKSGNENEAWALDLFNCLKSQKVKDFINKKYEKSVIAIN